MLTSYMSWINNLSPETRMVWNCAVNMVIGGILAIYIRELYKRCSSSVSNREQFAAVFPMLTLTTVAIIFVVKSSLALSLGLVGALSIVRFRAAIKSAEELVYLFFCIGVGLALGAEHRLLTFVAVFIISGFILGRHFFAKRSQRHNLLLTVTGDAKPFFQEEGAGVVTILENLTRVLTVQRFDLENGQVQFRCTVSLKNPEETSNLMSQLQTKIPQFQVSYVNLDTLL